MCVERVYVYMCRKKIAGSARVRQPGDAIYAQPAATQVTDRSDTERGAGPIVGYPGSSASVSSAHVWQWSPLLLR